MTKTKEIISEFNKIISAVGKLNEIYNQADTTMSDELKIANYAKLLDELDFTTSITHCE